MGTTQITASQMGDELFNTANPVIRVLEVTKADQTIDFEDIPDTWIADEFVNLNATVTSGLDIEFQVNPLSLVDSTLVEVNINPSDPFHH